MHSYLCYDALPEHRRGRGDKEKKNLLLVTTRPILHSGLYALPEHRRGRGDKEKKCHFFACHHEAYITLRTVYMHPKLC